MVKELSKGILSKKQLAVDAFNDISKHVQGLANPTVNFIPKSSPFGNSAIKRKILNLEDPAIKNARPGSNVAVNYSPTVHIASDSPQTRADFMAMLRSQKYEVAKMLRSAKANEERRSFA
jgi:hypothetical protein